MVSRDYRACYHEETPLGGPVGRAKQKISDVLIKKERREKRRVEALVLARDGALEGALCVFLEDANFAGARRKLIVPNISSVQELTRATGRDFDGRPGNTSRASSVPPRAPCWLKVLLLVKPRRIAALNR